MGFSDFFGATASDEYGRLLPNFQLLDHKFGIGLVDKFSPKLAPK